MDIPIVSWIDGIIKDAFKSVFSSINKSSDEYVKSLDLFRKGRAKYFRYLKERHGMIQILGMSKPIELDQIFVTVSVNSTIKAKSYSENDVSPEADHLDVLQTAKSTDKQTSLDPFQILNRPGSRNIILGKPGCGKTTLLKNIALIYSGNTKKPPSKREKELPLFPILILLRDFQHETTALHDYIANLLSNCGFPHAQEFLDRILGDGNAIVLFDGLDEVDNKQESNVLKQIFQLINRYPLCNYVLSSRTAAYKGNATGFVELEIEDFSKHQRIEFVNNWFIKEPEKSKRIFLSLKNYPQLEELAENPLLLSLMCILVQRELSLPRNRVELYDKCVRTMLVDWDASRGFRRTTAYEGLSDQRKFRLLNFCAAKLFVDKEVLFTKRKLISTVGQYLPKIGIEEQESLGVVNEITSHHGIIIPVSATTWCFSHLTLHEFFTANYIVDTRGEERLLENYISDPSWIEIFVTVATLLEDASWFVKAMLTYDYGDSFYNLALAAHCTAGDAVVSNKVRSEIYMRLSQELTKCAKVVRRVYERRKIGGRRKVLFFEANPSSDFSENGPIAGFLSAINCLVAISDQMTLTNILRNLPDKQRLVAKVINALLKAVRNQETFHVVSNVLPPGGISLPMQMTSFRKRVAIYFRPPDTL